MTGKAGKTGKQSTSTSPKPGGSKDKRLNKNKGYGK